MIVSSLEARDRCCWRQALGVAGALGHKRTGSRRYNRACLLLAVLEKRVGMPLGSQDVFVNVAGGGRVTEPAADLGIVIAAAPSYMDRPARGDVVVMGEVGLTGEIRAVTGVEVRVKEAAALGFREVVVPKGNLADGTRLALPALGVDTIHAAIDALLG